MPRAATAIAVVAWGTAVLAVVLSVVARPPLDEGLWFLAVDVMVACVYGTVAAVILARRRHPVPWLLALAAVGGGFAAVGFAYRALAAERPGLPELEALGALQGLAWVPGTLALFLVVPWLVRDHALGRAVWGVVAGTALIVAFLVTQVVGADDTFPAFVAAIVVLGLVTAAAVEVRHRRGPVAERNGLGWLALGTALLALSFLPLALPWGLLPIPVWFTPALHLASQAVYPAAVLVAVLRGRMWGLQLAVSRTVLAGLMTVALTSTYVVVTWLVTLLVPGAGFGQLVGAAGVAVAVQPLRLSLHRRVHRLVHGAAASPEQVVRRLGNHLSVEGSADTLLRGLAVDVGTAMRLESVTLRTPGADDVVWGMPSGTPTVVPLRHRGDEVGAMEVTLPGGESLGADGERTLGDLANVVATAVAVTRAAREVDDARQRLARARLEERRVIRREIHDGLGPSLAGLRLGLRGARNLLETDPAAAAELLGTLQDELDQRVDDVRTLSHSLLPPVLDELGLSAALHELAARWAEDGLTVRLHLDAEEVTDPQLAAAAYGIVGEALVNVSRHSGARECTVRTDSSSGSLLVTVTDPGRGIGEDVRAGVGSRAMRERAEEQGGHFDIRSAPGTGTVVEAVLPLGVTSRG
jgi:signal transduction histidine kinase